ncbi:MAG: serine/threonine-protein kinase [Verrucomicrobiota bacterium]|nr:serine/threonine-protein kinase [Verrucomicrobiota bacterium]
MTPERWQQVKAALAAALEQPTAQRADFVATACADDISLRREVQSLLEQPEDEFDLCADNAGLVHTDALASESGIRLGAYQLLRELGRGGMGTVWFATRVDDEFQKEVAIKLLKRGTDTDEVLRRFRAERAILARLEHPNIARLLDGGTTADGLPYFVMEYVVGARVTDYAFAQNLTTRERLELFRKICGAVQFAHQNLVVHRDLKPANILVTAEGEPKLLDFGMAKLLAAGDSSWEVTAAGRERLTPGYASPEQVRGEPVTTVSDVYSLGILLYELLTERPAHRFGRAEPTATEMQRVICEEEPLWPSIAATDPAVRRQLRGDLDTIVLRAVSKAPERRYRGAGQFADDIRRYLSGWPVRARKDTLGYRAGKFVRRNKLGVSAGTAVFVTLLAGVVATLHQKHVAERRFNDVRRLANSFMVEVHDSIADLPGALPARQLVTRRALEYLDTLAREAGGDDLSLKSELAAAYQHIGRVTFGMPQALASRQKAVSLNEEIVRNAPQNTAYRRQLAESYGDLSDVMKISGHSAAAVDYARKSLALVQALTGGAPQKLLADCYGNLAIALADAGDANGALDANQHAVEVQRAVVAANPGNKEAVRDLGNTYSGISDALETLGRYEEALAFTRQKMEAAEQLFSEDPRNTRYQRDMWASYFRLGRLLAAVGDSSAALRSYARAIEFMEALSQADPADQGHRRWLAVTYSSLGDLLVQLQRGDDALQRYQQAIGISQELFEHDPERVEARGDLIISLEALGRLFTDRGNAAQALVYLRRAESMAQSSAEQDPQNARVRSRLAQVCEALATSYEKLAQRDPSTTRAACEFLQRSVMAWDQVRQQGMLTPVDAPKAEAVARRLESCR